MALQSFPLNRANETVVAGANLIEITPENTHIYPAPIPAAASKPEHLGPVSFSGGAVGDDVDTATANATDAYTPKTQAQKATALGTTIAVDVAAARGWIAPGTPYVGNGANPAAPVVSSISPTTGTAASLPLTVTITGTGFTPYSTVRTGGQATPDGSGKYISPTQMKVAIWAAAPGTVSVAVEDHDKLSNTNIAFTVT